MVSSQRWPCISGCYTCRLSAKVSLQGWWDGINSEKLSYPLEKRNFTSSSIVSPSSLLIYSLKITLALMLRQPTFCSRPVSFYIQISHNTVELEIMANEETKAHSHNFQGALALLEF